MTRPFGPFMEAIDKLGNLPLKPRFARDVLALSLLFFLLDMGKQHQVHYITESGSLTLKNNHFFSHTGQISSQKRDQIRLTQAGLRLHFSGRIMTHFFPFLRSNSPLFPIAKSYDLQSSTTGQPQHPYSGFPFEQIIVSVILVEL